MKPQFSTLVALVTILMLGQARAGVGDPQIRTDHPWYPGELACSTFDRLFATQAELYERVVGVRPASDEKKALAAWLWRNTHYAHGEEGAEDLWGTGFTKGNDLRARDYWTGLFAHGFGLCGTTHSQWVAEMEALLGHGRGRGVGVAGHNSFEVFLKGGPYGDGKWVLLDHDISTVIFDPEGKRLLSIAEVQKDWQRFANRKFAPDQQRGWLICGLHPDDGSVYQRYDVAEYLAGYSGVPPLVHLRRGESLRRYLQPGLENGKTFVFWGRNYNTGGIPGPERAQTWVNQPEKMYRSRDGTPFKPGQARYANAVYVYKPDFGSGAYREGVLAEDEHQVTFEFYSPYIIAATPASDRPWGIYELGCKNGLILHGKLDCRVAVSIDQGGTWHDCGGFHDGLDLTDHVKGHRQYFLRLHAPAKALSKSGLTIVTVCQANVSVLPRLKDEGTRVDFLASGQAVVSAGPNLKQAQAHLVAGKFGSPQVTLEVATPRKEPIVAVYAAAHVNSSNPPRADVKYQIEFSVDGGQSWKPLVKDWIIPRQGEEPSDFWSQSMCWGSLQVDVEAVSKVRVRFHNSGGKNYARCEVHVVYRAVGADGMRVTFDWMDDAGRHRAGHVFAAVPGTQPAAWSVPTAKNVRTQWVELEPTAAAKGTGKIDRR
jgi:hypothetical protein